ncbi:matrixin family metalloprotease [Candidatus Wolfebacteria bacterium]|nr:matrixin family metalloprotease [Candidatus Wolfebacteria bacterium]
MRTRYTTALITLFGIALALPVSAARLPVSASHLAAEREFTLPAQAVEVASNVFSLGSATDPATGKVVEGFALVHPKRGYHHRPGHAGGPGGPGGGESSCFAYLARGAKWKSAEPWVMNPSNGDLLDVNEVFDVQVAAIAEWEDAGDGVLGNEIGTNIFEEGLFAPESDLSADTVTPDTLNEVYFGSIAEPNAIAVTIVWGIFGGPPAARELIEWDQVYDEVDFSWSLTGEAGKMDFENIAQHELGHALGLGHPSDSCTEETMFRFASEGETTKRDLNAGDIAGVNGLY